MQNPRVSLPSVGARKVRHGNTVAHDTYSSIFPVHKLRQTELTKDSRSKWRLWPLRPAVSCTRDGADWPKVVAVGAQQPISDFFGFIQIRDTLSTNGEHHRVAEVKSFPDTPKSMRSVNGYQNGANLKKWSVLLVCTIANACTTRVRKTEVRTTPVRSQQCECQQCEGVNSANETRVRMPTVRMPAVRCDIGAKKVRQQCECQQCESHFFFFFTDWKIQQQSSSSSKKNILLL